MGSGYVLRAESCTVRKRMRAKLREIKGRLQATRHDGIERQGPLACPGPSWLALPALRSADERRGDHGLRGTT